MPRPALRYTPPAPPAPPAAAAAAAAHAPTTTQVAVMPSATVSAAPAAAPAASTEMSLHQAPAHPQPSHRRPPRRRRDDLSDDDDDDQADATVHIRKWIRTAAADAPAPDPAASLPADAPADTPVETPADLEMPDTRPHPIYHCSAPNCPLPTTASFRSLAAIDSHIRQHHHYICRSARANTHARCNAVFPSNHLLDVHLHEAHSPLFWAQVARGDPALFACFVSGCTVKVDGVRERREHLAAVHGWGKDRYGHVQRQVARGASRYLREEEEEVGVAEDGGDSMDVDQVVGAFMDLDTSCGTEQEGC